MAKCSTWFFATVAIVFASACAMGPASTGEEEEADAAEERPDIPDINPRGESRADDDDDDTTADDDTPAEPESEPSDEEEDEEEEESEVIEPAGCRVDVDCKGNRICEEGSWVCKDPEPAADDDGDDTTADDDSEPEPTASEPEPSAEEPEPTAEEPEPTVEADDDDDDTTADDDEAPVEDLTECSLAGTIDKPSCRVGRERVCDASLHWTPCRTIATSEPEPEPTASEPSAEEPEPTASEPEPVEEPEPADEPEEEEEVETWTYTVLIAVDPEREGMEDGDFPDFSFTHQAVDEDGEPAQDGELYLPNQACAGDATRICTLIVDPSYSWRFYASTGLEGLGSWLPGLDGDTNDCDPAGADVQVMVTNADGDAFEAPVRMVRNQEGDGCEFEIAPFGESFPVDVEPEPQPEPGPAPEPEPEHNFCMEACTEKVTECGFSESTGTSLCQNEVCGSYDLTDDEWQCVADAVACEDILDLLDADARDALVSSCTEEPAPEPTPPPPAPPVAQEDWTYTVRLSVNPNRTGMQSGDFPSFAFTHKAVDEDGEVGSRYFPNQACAGDATRICTLIVDPSYSWRFYASTGLGDLGSWLPGLDWNTNECDPAGADVQVMVTNADGDVFEAPVRMVPNLSGNGCEFEIAPFGESFPTDTF